jgi:Spy/CpxP family protein refolding chaperone
MMRNKQLWRRRLAILALGTLGSAGVAAGAPDWATPDAHAQERGGFAKRLQGKLFPPRQVMRYADEIGLTSTQREQIKAIVKKAHSDSVDLKFKLAEEVSELEKMLAKDTVDATRAAAKADEVMELERQIKRQHLMMLIEIKNLLSPTQKQKLAELVNDSK